MTSPEIHGVLQDVRFRDWTFYVGELPGGDHYLQVRFYAPDNDRPDAPPELQKGRKWLIAQDATESELVQTALSAVKMAAEHELREQFTYRGRAAFGPHFNVNALVGLVDDRAFDVRPPLPPAAGAAAPPVPPLVELKPIPLTRDVLTRDAVRDSLHSRVCPACGRAKAERVTLCGECWDRVPDPTRQALLPHVNTLYVDALFDAMEFLGVAVFHAEAKP